jgi:hypothetical protein
VSRECLWHPPHASEPPPSRVRGGSATGRYGNPTFARIEMRRIPCIEVGPLLLNSSPSKDPSLVVVSDGTGRRPRRADGPGRTSDRADRPSLSPLPRGTRRLADIRVPSRISGRRVSRPPARRPLPSTACQDTRRGSTSVTDTPWSRTRAGDAGRPVFAPRPVDCQPARRVPLRTRHRSSPHPGLVETDMETLFSQTAGVSRYE